MDFTYDIYNRTEPSKIYLARPDKQLICALNGVDEASVSLTLNLNNAHELSFDVNRYVDGMESAGYDMLERFMNIYVTGIGWFKIQHPETSFDGQKEVRHVTAESLEIELQQYDLVGFKVNCGTEDSLEMMVEGNAYEENGVQKLHDVVRLYNPDNPKLSFLHLVLEDVPGWSVGYVDDYLDTSGKEPVLFKDKSVKFDVDNQDVYSFLCQEAAGAFHCIFLFDTEKCTVNAYPPETLGEDTNIFLGFRNLQNSVEVSVDDDSIYTVFHVAGDEDLNINYVNFGSSYIEDLSYFLNRNFMSQALIDKYTAWRDFREEKRPAYIEASKAYNAQLEIVTDLYERLPNDGCGTDWSTFSDEELAEAKENYLSQQAGYESLYVDENKAFDYEALKASVDFHDYDMIVRIILPNIEIEFANRGKDKELDPDDYLDSWETEWDLYGLNELEAKLAGYQDTIKTLKENGFDVVYSKENSLYTENYHNEMHETYLEAVNNYNDCAAAIGSDEDGREAGRKGEIKAAEAILENHNTVRRELEKEVAKENEQFGFTTGDFLILGKLYNATDYVNNNLFTTSLDTTVTAVDKQLALLKAAKEQLSSESQPQFTYSTSQDNLFALPEYRELHHKLQLGNFIRVSLRDDYEVKLRVISIGFNPLVLDNNLDIGFSNMIMSNSKRNDFASILDRSAKSSKNQISIGSGSSNNETPISDNLLRALLSSPQAGNIAASITAKSVRAIVGDFDALTADVVKAAELEAEVAKIGDAVISGGLNINGEAIVNDLTAFIKAPPVASLIAGGDGKICVIYDNRLFISTDNGVIWHHTEIPSVRNDIGSQNLQYDKLSGNFVLFENDFNLVISTASDSFGIFDEQAHSTTNYDISKICYCNGKYYILVNHNNIFSSDSISPLAPWKNEYTAYIYDMASDGRMLHFIKDSSYVVCYPNATGSGYYTLQASIPNVQFIVYTNDTLGFFLLSPEGAYTFSQNFLTYNYDGTIDSYSSTGGETSSTNSCISVKYFDETNILCVVKYDTASSVSTVYWSDDLNYLQYNGYINNEPLFTQHAIFHFKIKDIYYANQFFIIGDDGRLMHSESLSDFSSSYNLSEKLNAVIYNNGNLIAAENNGFIVNMLLTNDPYYHNWYNKLPYTDIDLYDIIYFKDDYYFCGDFRLCSLYHQHFVDMAFPVYALCSYNDSIVVVGDSADAALLTPEGNDFHITKARPGLETTLRSVATDNHTLIAVGDNGVIVEYCLSDGVLSGSMMYSAPAQKLRSVIYGNNLFVAVGDSGSIFTMDPSDRQWIRRSTSTIQTLNKVALGHSQEYNCDYFIAVGNNGTVLYSTDGRRWIKQTQSCEDDLRTVVHRNGQDLIITDSGTLYTTRYIRQTVGTNITMDRGGFYYSMTQSGNTNETYNLIYPVFDNPHLAIPNLECDHIGHYPNEGIYFEPSENDSETETVRIASPAMFDEGVYTNSLYDRSNPGRDLMPRLKNLIVETDVFKPIVYGSTTAGNCTYTTSKCAYYRIGRLVFITLYVVITKKGTSEGGIYIKGLPYKCAVNSPLTVGDTTKQSAAIHVHNATVYTGGYINLWRAGFTNTATANNENATLQFSQVADGFAFHISGCYLTNDPAKN